MCGYPISSTSMGVRSRPEQFPFSQPENRLVWIGQDVAADVGGPIDFANSTYAILDSVSAVPSLLGLWREEKTDELIIAICGICSFSLFPTDNSKSATWEASSLHAG